MYDPLGLSIGTSNLVAVRKGSPPVTRRALLTLFPDRPPKLGVPVDDPDTTDTGTLITGFVEQVGRSNSLTSADGSTHDPALLLVEALDALVTATGTDASASNITIAVPAHWSTQALRGLQDALSTHADFVRDGIAPCLVSDAVTALTALMSGARLPADGIVALVDFGGGGTSITLADAASGFTPIADTVRYPDFSGDLIDEALLVHVLEKVGQTNGVDSTSTAVVGQLAKVREECRLAKERLSKEEATELVVELSGQRARVQVSRDELESLIEDRLRGVFSAFDDVLRRNRVRRKDLAAVAMSGGVARLPFVAQHLSSHAKVSLVTAVQPEIATAVGAVVLSSRRPAEQPREQVEVPTMAAMVGASTGGFATSADAFGPPTSAFGPPTGGLTAPDIQALFDADPAETVHELAWSQADDSGDEPVFYTGEPYDDDDRATPSQLMRLPKVEPPERRRRGYRLPQLVFGLAALISMVAIGGVAFSLTSATDNQAPPAPSSTTAVPPPPRQVSKPPSPSPLPPPPPSAAAPPESPAPPPAAAPPPTSEAPPPPPPPPPVMTTYEPPPSPTHQAPSTTQPPPSTATTTTPPPPPTTTSTTTPPPQASTSATPTTSVPMTTEYLRLPFLPVPIPVQVPDGQGGASQPQNPYQQQNPYQPQYPYQQQNPYMSPGY
jgi:Hsp70 protein